MISKENLSKCKLTKSCPLELHKIGHALKISER